MDTSTGPGGLRPIPVNKGGVVDPRHQVGHDREFETLIHALEGHGARLTGERRMGKTSLLRRLESVVGDEHLVISINGETSDLGTVTGRLAEQLKRHSKLKSFFSDTRITVGFKGAGWSVALERPGAGDDVVEQDDLFDWAARNAGSTKVIIVIDEVTVLVQNVEKTAPGNGVEFLRGLRRARQENTNVTTVLAGSIGLHHAVDDMAVVNDLEAISVAALLPADARLLAECLLLESVEDAPARSTLARAVAEEAEGIAFYIHHLADRVIRTGASTADDVRELRSALLDDPDDILQVGHYDDRIPGYFGDDANTVRSVLDVYALAASFLSPADVAATITADGGTPPTTPTLVRIVRLLERDHYLQRKGARNRFATLMLRDGWIRLRKLEDRP